MRREKVSRRKHHLPCNWRSRLVLFKSFHNLGTTIEYDLEFASGRTPVGFYRHVGSFVLDRDADGIFAIHSDVEKYFQRRGLGLKAYLTILQDLGSLRSYYHNASFEARGLWRKIMTLGIKPKLDFWDGSITVKFPRIKFEGLAIVLKEVVE